jgi:Tol biopolymer transport system component
MTRLRRLAFLVRSGGYAHIPASTALVVTCLVIACGGGGSPGSGTGPTPSKSVASVRVSPASDTTIVHGTVQLTATPLDSNGQTVGGRTITWSSSDPALATVSTTGLVSAHALGDVTITAKVDAKSGTATLSLAPLVTVGRHLPSLFAGDTTALVATLTDAVGQPLSGTVQWTSAQPGIATVSATGVVSGLAPGRATVTARAGSGVDSLDVVVLVWTPRVSPDLVAVHGATRFDGQDITGLGILSLNGSGWQLVSEAEEDVSQYALSPDRTEAAVFYLRGSTTPNPPYGHMGLYVLNLDGSGQHVVSAGDGRSPSWSPDGSHLAYLVGVNNGASLHSVAAGGGANRTLTDGTKIDVSPKWSPDGRQIAWRRAGNPCSELWLMDANGAGPHKVVLPTNIISFEWSPDGKQFAYQSCVGVAQPIGIWLANVDGTGVRPLSPNCTLPATCGAPDYYEFSWAPDGNRIAIQHDSATVTLVRRDGSASVDLHIPLTCCAGAFGVRWSADARQLTFATLVPRTNPNLPRNSAVAVMGADGSAPTVVSPPDDVHGYGAPAWR